MKKVLKVVYMRLPKEFVSDSCGILWRVVEQSHRGNAFGCDGSGFESSNGMMLQSVAAPGWCNKQTVFVRGSSTEKDNLYVLMPGEFFQKFLVTVREYNATEFEE